MRRVDWKAGALAAGLTVVCAVWARVGFSADRRRFPPAGRLLPTSAGRVHWVESGSGSPPVVLESGLAGTSLSWTYVQQEVAQFTKVASYDRLGFGWSDSSGRPRLLPALVEELHNAIAAAGLTAPYLLVGHSFGGLIVRAFAQTYPDLVAGLVLVDPVSSRSWASCPDSERQRLRRGVRLAGRGVWLARLGILRLLLQLVVLGRSFLPKTLARIAAPGASSTLARLVREVQKLPEHLWPVVRAQWSRPVGFATIAAYLEQLEANCSRAEAAFRPSTLPVTILSAGSATPDEVAERQEWLSHSIAGQHIPVYHSGHWIQVESPESVVRAIQDTLTRLPARVQNN